MQIIKMNLKKQIAVPPEGWDATQKTGFSPVSTLKPPTNIHTVHEQHF